MEYYIQHIDTSTVMLRIPDYQMMVTDFQPHLDAGFFTDWFPALPIEWQTNIPSPNLVNLAPPEQGYSWRQLYIIATGQCNLACQYCAQARGAAGNMPVDLMLSSIAEFLENSPNPEGIVFYGGEPLLNWKAIQPAISLVCEQNTETELTLFTNGALVTPEIAAFLANHRVGMIVSLDGDPQSHNTVRPLRKNNEGSYAFCEAGFRHLQEAGCVVGISCVIGPHNADRVEAITHHLCQLRPVNIGMNPLHVEGRSGYGFSPKASAAAILRGAAVAAEHNIETEQVARRIRSFVYEKPRRGDCPACRTRLVVTPEGRYGPCEGAYPFMQDWFFDERMQVKTLASQLAEWAGGQPGCNNCPARGLCGAGCVLDAYLTEGCFAGIDQRTCELAQAVLAFVLETVVHGITREQKGTILSVDTKEYLLKGYLSQHERPLQSSSRFGEQEHSD